MTLDPSHVATATLAVLLLGIDLGVVALALGAVTGSRGTAIGITSAFAAVSYLISSLAPVVHWTHPLRYASLFYWAVGNQQLTHGARPGSFAVLLGVAIIAAIGANIALASRHSIGGRSTALLAPNPGDVPPTRA